MAAGTEVPRRRLGALALMERVRRQDIEARMHDLARLRAEAAAIQAERATLLARLADETHISSLEAAAYLGQFIRSVRARVAALDASFEALRPRLTALEDEVAALYREKRTYEAVREAGERTNLQIRQKRQDDATDDLVLMRWNRA